MSSETTRPAGAGESAPTPSAPAASPPPAAPERPAAAAPPDRRRGGGGSLWNVFLPNRGVPGGTMQLVVAFQVALFLLIWFLSPYKVLPRPGEVLDAFRGLWFSQGLAQELGASVKLILVALAWTTVISLGLSYLTVLPFFRPLVNALSKGRYLSLVGFSLVFTLMLGGGQGLKLALLVFGMTVYFVTSMASVVASIPKADFDHARTLRMGEWRVVWEVVILGTADKAFEVMRQNAAIGWTLLTMVEGISRAEGGLGNLLLTQQKYFRIADVFAIQITILIVALVQDWFIGLVRKAVCPYADLILERKEG